MTPFTAPQSRWLALFEPFAGFNEECVLDIGPEGMTAHGFNTGRIAALRIRDLTLTGSPQRFVILVDPLVKVLKSKALKGKDVTVEFGTTLTVRGTSLDARVLRSGSAAEGLQLKADPAAFYSKEPLRVDADVLADAAQTVVGADDSVLLTFGGEGAKIGTEQPDATTRATIALGTVPLPDASVLVSCELLASVLGRMSGEVEVHATGSELPLIVRSVVDGVETIGVIAPKAAS